MRFASSDITSFSNGACPEGGHQRKIKNIKEVAKGEAPIYADERLVIDCPACEPLLNAPDSWSGDELAIPLTRAEKLAAKKAEDEAMMVNAQFAAALAQSAREHIAAGANS